MSKVTPADWPRIERVVGRVRHGVLTTVAGDGTPHSVLVNPFAVPASGLVVVFSRAGAVKVRHLRARPVASIALQEGTGYLSVVGPCRLTGDDSTVLELVSYFEAKYERPPRGDSHRVAIVLEAATMLGALA
jgi:general stress protein 26